jgi:hypothetical protein
VYPGSIPGVASKQIKRLAQDGEAPEISRQCFGSVGEPVADWRRRHTDELMVDRLIELMIDRSHELMIY